MSGTRGRTWQYTAIDVASSFVWAEVHITPVNPKAKHTWSLVRRVPADLVKAGWKLKAVTTDNGSEFRSEQFRLAARRLDAEHRFIRAGRPQTNGCIERVQRTVLEVLATDLSLLHGAELHSHPTRPRRLPRLLNFERAHTGRRNLGRTAHTS